MEGLALTYTLANSPSHVIKGLHESGESVKELTTSRYFKELIGFVKEALPQKQTVADASSSTAEPTSFEQNPPGGPSTATAKPAHGLAPTAGGLCTVNGVNSSTCISAAVHLPWHRGVLC